MAARSPLLFVGRNFIEIAGQSRADLAALDLATGPGGTSNALKFTITRS